MIFKLDHFKQKKLFIIVSKRTDLKWFIMADRGIAIKVLFFEFPRKENIFFLAKSESPADV